jgi:hypothetical protein
MSARTIVFAGLAAVFASTAALAASTSSPQTVVAQPVPTEPAGPAQPAESSQQLGARCAALEVQFDKMIPIFANSTAAGTARQLRAEGDSQCKAGNQGDGIDKLRQAVEAIGGTPGA